MSSDEVKPSEEKSVSKEEDGKTEQQVNETAAVEDIESLKEALAQEKTKAESYLANWQRAQADYINFKRHAEQERSEVTKLANAMLIANLISVVDDLERALASLPAKLANLSWVDGIRLIYRKIMAVLESQGLSEIKALGEPFDPNLHEAALHAEGEPGKIIEVLQKGYKLYDKVIRPAMVVVGESKKEEKPNKQSSD